MLAVAEASGLFSPGELAEIEAILSGYFAGARGGGDFWLTARADETLAGIAYCAPETLTSGTWNLQLIAVDPVHQGRGLGTLLVDAVETSLRERGERLLLVETSGVASFEPTRRFYRKCGYHEEARIRDFYEPGADKIVFRKALAQS